MIYLTIKIILYDLPMNKSYNINKYCNLNELCDQSSKRCQY